MIISVIKILRPKQWTKNLIIFSGLIFSVNLFHTALIIKTFLAFIIFCGLSSSIYIINDIFDLESDRKHPIKRLRPLPSGRLKVSHAVVLALVISASSILCSFSLNYTFGIIGVIYFITFLLYSLYLKHVVILDVLIISMGFVLRAVSGALVIEVRVSPWFLICTFLLSLFLALGKRRHELVLLNDQAGKHRKILDEYSPYFLDQMISVVTPSTLLAYSIYTLSKEAIKPNLEYTVPFVIYGIFRYLYLIHQKGEGGNPEIILLTDLPIIINLILWGCTCVYLIYFYK